MKGGCLQKENAGNKQRRPQNNGHIAFKARGIGLFLGSHVEEKNVAVQKQPDNPGQKKIGRKEKVVGPWVDVLGCIPEHGTHAQKEGKVGADVFTVPDAGYGKERFDEEGVEIAFRHNW